MMPVRIIIEPSGRIVIETAPAAAAASPPPPATTTTEESPYALDRIVGADPREDPRMALPTEDEPHAPLGSPLSITRAAPVRRVIYDDRIQTRCLHCRGTAKKIEEYPGDVFRLTGVALQEVLDALPDCEHCKGDTPGYSHVTTVPAPTEA